MCQTVARVDARTKLGSFGNKLLSGFLLLSDLAVALLQPALGGVVFVLALVLGKRGEESGDSIDGSCLALLGCLITRRDPSKGRSRCKKREKIGRQLVRHGDARLGCGRFKLASRVGAGGGSGIAVRCQRPVVSRQVKKSMKECQEEVARIQTTPVWFAVMMGEQAEMGWVKVARLNCCLPGGQSARASLGTA